MEVVQGLVASLYLTVATILGVRLLRKAARARLLPELLLGLSFILSATLGSPLEVLSDSVARDGVAPWAGSVLAGGKLLTMAGLSAYAAFTWRVFRPDKLWAALLTAVLVATQVVAYFGFALSGTFTTGLNEGFWFWIEFGARVGVPLWCGVECLRYHAMMTRRARIGMAEPIVQNRFALWAIASAGGILMVITSTAPQLFTLDNLIMQSGIVYLAFCAGGLTSSFSYWLAFFAPGWYRRRIEGPCAAAVGA
jgi:hypothetical protein